jgi:hypothetical protein
VFTSAQAYSAVGTPTSLPRGDVRRTALISTLGRRGRECRLPVAARILDRIGERAERTGNVAWAVRRRAAARAGVRAAGARGAALAHLRAPLDEPVDPAAAAAGGS